MGIVSRVSSTLQRLLGEVAERVAAAEGVIVRKRKFTGASVAAMLVLGLLRDPKATFEDLAATAGELGVVAWSGEPEAYGTARTAVRSQSRERNTALFHRRSAEMHPDIAKYNGQQDPGHSELCDVLAQEIDKSLPEAESKIWHAHPVWFLDDNPIVGYSKQKPGIRLMFWSGVDFDEAALKVVGKKFKDASVFFNEASEIRKSDLRRWLKKSREIQWDYKNIVKRKGRLEKLK